jgi:hypothetical protein
MDSGVGALENLSRFAGPSPEQSKKEPANLKPKKLRRVRRHWLFEMEEDWNLWSFLGLP